MIDFDNEIKQHLNILLEEFEQYKQRNRNDQTELQNFSNKVSQYFDDLSSDFSQALSGLDEEQKAQGLSSINQSNEMANNHFQRQVQRLQEEFEQTKNEYRQRARSLR